MSEEELKSEAHRSAVIQKFMQQPLSVYHSFIIESCQKESLAGWVTELLSMQQVNEWFLEGWSPTLTFVHKEADGNPRRVTMPRQVVQTPALAFRVKPHVHSDAAMSAGKAGSQKRQMPKVFA